jgi:hypothetical protein
VFLIVMRVLRIALVIALLATAGAAHAQSNSFDGLDTRGRAYVDPEVYAKSKAQWLARVDAMPRNVDVLEGAADFFIIRDRELASELFERIIAIEPQNHKWLRKLSQLHRLNATSGDVTESRLALSLMERAYPMGNDIDQRSMLAELPMLAFEAGDMEKARAYAERLLSSARRQQDSWNLSDSVHKGNLILGRIAAIEGRLADAVGFLRASGETTGSPVLNSFGPNMSLAKDLLERGEREAVLAYFEACRVFWKMGGTRLDAWRQDVEAGRIPNFGANLRY